MALSYETARTRGLARKVKPRDVEGWKMHHLNVNGQDYHVELKRFPKDHPYHPAYHDRSGDVYGGPENPGLHPWFKHLLLKRYHRKMNSLALIVGEAGIGKSAMGLKLCETMSRTMKRKFDISQVVFSAKDFFEAITTLKEGSWILFDEPAVEVLASREWYKDVQKCICYACESFRSFLLNVVFTTISPSLIDVNIRERLMHFMISCRDRGFGVVYRYLPSIFSSQVRTPNLGELYMPMPSADLWEDYSLKKLAFQKEKYYRYKEEATITEIRGRTFNEIVSDVLNRPFDFVVGEKVSVALIMRETRIGFKRATTLKKLLEEEITQLKAHAPPHRIIRLTVF